MATRIESSEGDRCVWRHAREECRRSRPHMQEELQRKAEAASAVNELLAIDPEFAVHARRYIQPWHYASGFLKPLLEGLRKAGLEIPESTRCS